VLAERVAAGAGYDTRCAGIHLTFSPSCDFRSGTGNSGVWSGQWEGFGEDPFLAGEMSKAYVRGYQGTEGFTIDSVHVASAAKHFIGLGQVFSGKDGGPVMIDELRLREYDLRPFEQVVRAGVSCVVVSSGLVNGVPVAGNSRIVTDLLKGELGFEGFVLSDNIFGLHEKDRIATSRKEAVERAINAGIDVVTTDDLRFCDYLVELVREGKVSIDRIDDAVRRVLRAKLRLNLWNRPILYGDYSQFASRRELAREAARQSMVLLKNENRTLPLRKGTRILVTGPNADSIRALNGGWTYSWQGDVATDYGASFQTIQEEIASVNGENATIFLPGLAYNKSGHYRQEYEDRIEEAIAAAKNVDVILCIIGENSYAGKPGDLTDLELSPRQQDLVRRLSTVGKPIVLILNEGRPRIVTPIAGLASAIVDIMLPGNYGAEALSSLLFGKSNFIGKLPFSYPKNRHNLMTYIHKRSEISYPHEGDGSFNYPSSYDPIWPFGHGLSYTTFKYQTLTVSSPIWDPSKDKELNVTVSVKNTGNYSGTETVLLYSADLYASVSPDVRRLRKFTSVTLDPGDSALVSFVLTPDDLSFVNEKLHRVTEPGDFILSAGNLTVPFRIL
jgi:beta-glucosidase